tara:strand:- start:10023 stop:10907 length:885 start_codon:yes stop_codon:yes gene_type:complete
MKKLIIFILIILSNKISLAENFQATLDTNAILIGQQIKFSLKCSDLNSEINWPILTDSILNGIEIIKFSKIDTIYNKDTSITYYQEFIITAWDSGAYYIPPIKLNNNLVSEGFLLNVFSIDIKESDSLKDIKEQIEAKFSLLDYWIWILVLLIVLLVIYLFNKFFNKSNQTATTKKVVIKIAPNIIATNALDKLEKKKLWQEGKIKEYYSEISEILRTYIDSRFNIIALELTTEEIINKISKNISSESTKELRTLLLRSDLAKFAKSKPIDVENNESMLLAKKLVDQTKVEIHE